MKKYLLWFSCLTMVFAPAISFAQNMSEIRSFEEIPIESNTVLRVGVAANRPPLVFKYDRKIVGLEADLAMALGEALEKNIEFVNFKHKHLLTELKNRNIDIVMSGLAMEGGLRVRAAFTEPYMTSGQMVMCRKEDVETYGSVLAVRETSSRIGVAKKSIGHRYVERACPKARIKTYNHVKGAVKDLSRGKIDLYIDDGSVVRWLARRHADKNFAIVSTPLTSEQFAWAMHKKHKEQVEKVNEILDEWRSDGTLDKIIDKWIPRDS